ncbi:unnamed protein product [Cylindrotheca closterium]|uniref:Uncharacterized protein n=1 Tax=Cylindrotheca closterium TaxID=2856 RepID=A0AAD2CI72_9STRA|nr:unnamed protein product [Cylindrotheca closterium]
MDIETTGADESTPLHQASKKGQAEVVKFLLRQGANTETTCGADDATPLHDTSDERVLQLFLGPSHRANLEARNELKQTPLHLAASQGRLEAAQMLLDGGVDMEATDSFGLTPLDQACYSGFVEVARLLLDRGAAIERKPNLETTPLYHAAGQGKTEVVWLLLCRYPWLVERRSEYHDQDRKTKRRRIQYEP